MYTMEQRDNYSTRAYHIEYKIKSGIQADINTIFCKMSKHDKSIILDVLQNALYIICEAQHEIDIINQYQREQVPALGRGKNLKSKMFNGISSTISAMLKQHSKDKDKDFSKLQIKNIEVLLECFTLINKQLKENKWNETIDVPNIKFKQID